MMIFTDKILAWFGVELVFSTDVIPDLVLSSASFAVEVEEEEEEAQPASDSDCCGRREKWGVGKNEKAQKTKTHI